MRGHTTVTALTDELFDDFSEVWVQRRVDAGLSRDAALRDVRTGRLHEAVDHDEVVVLVALEEHAVVGYAWITDRPLSTLLDSPPVTVEEVFVLPARRHRGSARALLAAAATHAQRMGSEQLVTIVPAQAKDTQRALARLGFAPAITARVASTSAVLRRLRGGDPRYDNVLLHRRRSLRARVG